MSTERPMDDLLRAWFEEDAPPKAPSRVLSSTVARTRVLPQRRGIRGWQLGFVVPRLAAAGLVVTMVATIVGLLPGAIPPMGGQPVPSPSASPSVSPSPTPSTLPSRAAPSIDPSAGEAAFERWQISYRRPANWTMFDETSTVDRGFDAFDNEGNVVGSAGFGTLAGAVHPNSSYVVYPLIDQSIDTTLDAYLAWLLAHPRLDVSEPVDVTVAGRRAKQVEFALKPGERENYVQGQIPSRLGVAWFGDESVAVGPSERDRFRFTLVDLGTETLLVYAWTFSDDMSPISDELDELLASLTIEPRAPASPSPAGSDAPSP